MYIKDHKIYLRIPYNRIDEIKRVPGRRWNANTRHWAVDLSEKRILYLVFPEVKDGVEEKLKEFRAIYEERKKVRKWKIEQVDVNDYVFKRKPFKHQDQMFRRAVAFNNYAFFCEMGTGKTKVMIDMIVSRGVRTLIVAPKTICENWVPEFEKDSNIKPVLLFGDKKKRLRLLDQEAQVFIINYEGLKVIEKYDWRSFDCVILDESTAIKNPKAKRTKFIIKMFVNTMFKYILTGTPVAGSPLDIYTQFQFLDPTILGFNSYYSFRNYFAEMGGYGGYEIIRWKNMHILQDKIKNVSIQLKKEDCIDLPAKVYTKIMIDMPPELKKQYEELKKENMLEMADGEVITVQNILTKLLRLQQLIAGHELKNNPKVNEVERIITESRGTQKIIWCRFIKSIELIEALCDKLKITYCTMRGATKNRMEMINDFQAGKYEVFIGQLQTGGKGITLTAAPLTIYFENDFSLDNRLQSEARNHRIGQKMKVTYVDLLYKDSIDGHIMKAIGTKQNVSDALVQCFRKGEY